MVVGFVGDDGRGEAGGLLPEQAEEGVELAVEALGVEDAVALAERFGDLLQFVQAGRDRDGRGAEVAEIVTDESAAIFVEGVLADVAAKIGGVGVQGGSPGVVDGAVAAVKLVDAVGAAVEGAGGGVILAGVDAFGDDGGVDDRVRRVAVGELEGAAGEAEDAVSGRGGAADGGLADGQGEQGSGGSAGFGSARGSATVGGQLVEVGSAGHGLCCSRVRLG